jgi:hypothetical protein
MNSCGGHCLPSLVAPVFVPSLTSRSDGISFLDGDSSWNEVEVGGGTDEDLERAQKGEYDLNRLRKI